MDAAPVAHARLDEAMRPWFQPEHSTQLSKRSPFTETDLRGISDVLRRSGQVSWSRIPRIYATLRSIDQLAAIDVFLSSGITDLSFPFSQRTLPEALKSQSVRCDFLEAQAIVLTKALDLEREDGRHRHFADTADSPFEKLAELGKGAHGYVDRVLSTISYREYARKLIPRGRTFRKDQAVLRDFEKELGMLKKLSHQHIVELIGSYTDPRYVGIIMSPVADCNLKEFLDLDPVSADTRSFLRTFFGCLASAIRYLHENRVRHKDVKPQNVLVKRHHVYLTDFGISLDWSELNHSTTTGPTSKTLRYCAPEVAADEPRKSSADIWSLGCVFLEIWTVLCDHTISELNTHMTAVGSLSVSYHSNFEALTDWSGKLSAGGPGADAAMPYLWISSMLRKEPANRCTAQDLCDQLQEMNRNPDVPFSYSGLCCTEDEDTAESVLSSAFEPDDLETADMHSHHVTSAQTEPLMQQDAAQYIGYPSPTLSAANSSQASASQTTGGVVHNSINQGPPMISSPNPVSIGQASQIGSIVPEVISSLDRPNVDDSNRTVIPGWYGRRSRGKAYINESGATVLRKDDSETELETTRQGTNKGKQPVKLDNNAVKKDSYSLQLPGATGPITSYKPETTDSRLLQVEPATLPTSIDALDDTGTVNDILRDWLTPLSTRPEYTFLNRLKDSREQYQRRLAEISPNRYSWYGFPESFSTNDEWIKGSLPALLEGMTKVLDYLSVAYIITSWGFRCCCPPNLASYNYRKARGGIGAKLLASEASELAGEPMRNQRREVLRSWLTYFSQSATTGFSDSGGGIPAGVVFHIVAYSSFRKKNHLFACFLTSGDKKYFDWIRDAIMFEFKCLVPELS